MEYTQEMKNRLKRIEGQVRGVLRLMEEGKDCKSVITQMSATKSAMDRAMAFVIAKNMQQCILDQVEKGEDADQVVEEAIQLLVKSR
ncbi:cytoplasmic protein [Alkalihalophilus pseudofirmus]|uniref:Metal-sensitive transcriptional regulator n=1 Tax=Alkalihalophilus pseudofirmus TaxID=79885 RepID=A0AAJ2KVD7_ALKPS|nr:MULTISPECIES: metal-sensitive transcriptional regulator [Alkalihalophilus]MDV2883936.1 metal-sensitive transcriptional regulator [Alkalihalophilus pseudofirmus]MED1602517.1 metal-sensitive transcriptional regulator [Alkalihalophilus marmarensis]OLS35702.1 cytoplasmic protein [Alkalihalophilus pseudofirmus]